MGAPAEPRRRAAEIAGDGETAGGPCPDGWRASEAFPAVYDELRRIASKYFDQLPPGQTLQPTALVHEAYLQLARDGAVWQNDRHFVALAVRVMRCVLVDQVRRRSSRKRGGDRGRVRLEANAIAAPDEGGLDVIALEEALERLAALDERRARVAELRIFLGLGIAEIARVLERSAKTIEKDWAGARAWLRVQLEA